MHARHANRRSLAIRVGGLALGVALGTSLTVTAHAENLMDAYRQALRSDPVLKQAEAQSRIGAAGVGESRALLLPQLNGSASFSSDHGSQHTTQLIQTPSGPQFLSRGGGTGGRTRDESVGINQVLFDLGKFEQLRASQANAKATDQQYASARQDLILRVAQAYFTVLTDEDQLKFARSNEASLKKQLDQAQAKFDVGFAAITDVADAKASYDSAIAEVIAAKNTLFNARQALAQITGQAPGKLEVLTKNLPLQPPAPNNMADWVTTALASNPSLQAQRELVTSAQHDISAARAGHLPTLGASVDYSRTASWGSGNNVSGTSNLPGELQRVLHADSRSTGTTVGLVLTVPLFEGGGIQAQVHQAVAQRDQAKDILEQDRRTIVSNTRNAFKAIHAGVSSVKAQQQAVVSAKTALDATRAGYQIGTQTIVNVLIAQSKYFNALSAYSQARHSLVINRLNLDFSAGTLTVKDLEAVNALLR